MLTWEENVKNRIALNILSKFGLFPYDYDSETGNMKKQKSLLKRALWILFFILLVPYTAHMTLGFIYVLFFAPKFNPNHVCVHWCFLDCCLAALYLAYNMKFQSYEDIKTVWNELLKHGQSKREDDAGEKDNAMDRIMTPKPKMRSLAAMSVQELLLINFPVTAYTSVFGGLSLALLDPTRPQLLFSLLSPEYQNKITFTLLAGVQILMTNFFAAYLYFEYIFHLIMFEFCNDSLRSIIADARNCLTFGGKCSQQYLISLSKRLRKLQILVHLFNGSSAYSIFCIKLLDMSMGVSGIVLAIHYGRDDPVVAAYSFLIAFDAVCFFAVIYEKAFAIPNQIEVAKRLISIASARVGASSKKGSLLSVKDLLHEKYLKEELKSIPKIGVRVGGFHVMERTSTPVFIDFIVEQVSSILIGIQ